MNEKQVLAHNEDIQQVILIMLQLRKVLCGQQSLLLSEIPKFVLIATNI